MNLDSLLSPRNVAVIGASDDPDRLGGRVFANMLKGFAGQVTPINTKRDRVQGRVAYPSLSSLETVPDLALVVSPPAATIQVAEECAELGVPSMIVITSGFAEVGGEGELLQDRLAAIANEAGISLLGPNCVGLLNLPLSLRASFVQLRGIPLNTGPAAVVSQSGAVGLALFEYAQERGLGVSYLCTTGNEAQLTCAEMIESMVEQPDVRVVLAYMEGLRDPDALLKAGYRAQELGKPVIVLKTGGSRAGGQAAASHTGSLAVPDRVIDAVLDEAGMIRVRSMREILDYGKGFGVGRLPGGRRVIICTGSGGIGVTMADAAEAVQLDVARPSPQLEKKLSSLVPAIGSVTNPIDTTAQIINAPDHFESLLRTIAATDEYDAVVFANISRTQVPRILDLLAEISDNSARPILAQSHYAEISAQLTQRGVPTIDDPASVLQVIAAMAAWQERLRERRPQPGSVAAPQSNPALLTGAGPLTADRTQQLLDRYGIPIARSAAAVDEDAAVAEFRRAGGPVALKVSAPWMAHKSEHGGVILGCDTDDAVRHAYRQLNKVAAETAPPGESADIVVQEMAEAGLELVCGAVRDPAFGPVVTVGLGGVLVELIDDTAMALAPVSMDQATRMIRRLGHGRLIGHPRGLSAAQADAVADIIVAVSKLMCSEPAVLEVDLNPLIVGPSGIRPVDALIVGAGPASRSDDQGQVTRTVLLDFASWRRNTRPEGQPRPVS